jgi:hypothetical protein
MPPLQQDRPTDRCQEYLGFLAEHRSTNPAQGRQKMRAHKWITIAAGAAATLLGPGYAGAAPPSVAITDATSAVTLTAAHDGTRRGSGYREYNDQNYREYNNPDAYPTGSSHWWEEMDRQHRGGQG